MDQWTDTNEAIWKSEEVVQNWTANAAERERAREAQWRFMGELLPFEAAWERVNDRQDPEAASKRLHRTPQEQSRFENHTRFMIPLTQQVDYLQAAGFEGIEVYWKHLENVIYGGCRPT
jgi:hypothetical protein